MIRSAKQGAGSEGSHHGEGFVIYDGADVHGASDVHHHTNVDRPTSTFGMINPLLEAQFATQADDPRTKAISKFALHHPEASNNGRASQKLDAPASSAMGRFIIGKKAAQRMRRVSLENTRMRKAGTAGGPSSPIEIELHGTDRSSHEAAGSKSGPGSASGSGSGASGPNSGGTGGNNGAASFSPKSPSSSPATTSKLKFAGLIHQLTKAAKTKARSSRMGRPPTGVPLSRIKLRDNTRVAVTASCFSPGQQSLIVGDEKGTIMAWDLSEYELEVSQLSTHASAVTGLLFPRIVAPQEDGGGGGGGGLGGAAPTSLPRATVQTVISVGHDGALKRWELPAVYRDDDDSSPRSTAMVLVAANADAHDGSPIVCLVEAPDRPPPTGAARGDTPSTSSRIVTVSVDGTVRLWDSYGLVLIACMRLGGGRGMSSNFEVSDFGFHRDARWFYALSKRGVLRVWPEDYFHETVDAAIVMETPPVFEYTKLCGKPQNQVACITCLEGPPAHQLSDHLHPRHITAATDGSFKVWNSTPVYLSSLSSSSSVSSTAAPVLHASSSFLATSAISAASAASHHESECFLSLKHVLDAHQSSISIVASAPDRSVLLTAATDGSIKMWDHASLSFIETLTRSRSHGPTTHMTFSTNSQMFAVGGSHGSVVRTLQLQARGVMR
jgi:WD40 repeat protein